MKRRREENEEKGKDREGEKMGCGTVEVLLSKSVKEALEALNTFSAAQFL